MPLDHVMNLGGNQEGEEDEEVITAAEESNNPLMLPNLSITGKGAVAAQYSSALGAYDKHNGTFVLDSSQATSTR